MQVSNDLPTWAVVFAGASALAAAITTVISGLSMRGSRRDQESKQMLEQAVISLERAYEAISTGASPDGPPKADRIAWLTAARLLTQYRLTKRLVTSTPHKLVLEEQEEHWRHRFYLILQPLSSSRSRGYYSGMPSEGGGPIEPMSAVVVHTFAKWPEGKSDPLTSLQRGEVPPDAEFLKGNIGLRRYLEELEFIASNRDG